MSSICLVDSKYGKSTHNKQWRHTWRKLLQQKFAAQQEQKISNNRYRYPAPASASAPETEPHGVLEWAQELRIAITVCQNITSTYKKAKKKKYHNGSECELNKVEHGSATICGNQAEVNGRIDVGWLLGWMRVWRMKISELPWKLEYKKSSTLWPAEAMAE